MAKTLRFKFEGDQAKKIEEIRSGAATRRIAFHGDLKSGWFSGGMSGTDLELKCYYRIIEKEMIVVVEEKPFAYDWKRIESILRELIEG